MLSLNNEEFLTLHGIQNENVKNKMHDCCIQIRGLYAKNLGILLEIF